MLPALALGGSLVATVPVPEGEPASDRFRVFVEERETGVYRARVAPGDPDRRARLIAGIDQGPVKGVGEQPYDEAAFASWDQSGPVRVRIEANAPIRDLVLLPRGAAGAVRIEGRTATFEVRSPRAITAEIDGDVTRSLHLFANPLERNAPNPGDPNVVYFGPGVHEIGHLEVKDGSTVYLAPGAVVRAGIGKGEKGTPGTNGETWYPPSLDLKGNRIRVLGRGVLDGALAPVHARHLASIVGRDVSMEGVVLRDASVWTVPIRRSDRVTLRNVKVLGYRANSDGFDIASSRDVTIDGCFLRTFDDLIVVKSDPGAGPVHGIRIRRCVLWNEFAHALSLGAEMSEPVSDVRFEDCDVIHDRGREWTLRVFQADKALVRNVRFERIRVEESRRLASVWIGKAFWSRDRERGRVEDVTFRGIDVRATFGGAKLPEVEVVGFDADHRVRGVTFDRVRVGGAPLRETDIKTNEYASGLTVRP